MKSINNEMENMEVLSVFEDIKFESLIKTLKEREEELESIKQKTEFFSSISHEFKTPLNVIMGAIQIIELYTSNGVISDPENKLDKYLNTMKQNAYRLLRLINNIIDLSRIDSRYLELESHNYDIASMLEGIIASIEIYSKAKAVSIKLNKECDKILLSCDADKIEKIILNLLSNALKFTNENGNIEVNIGLREDKVYMSVKDDGVGIPKDKLDFIFKRFRQVDRSFTRNREGSGIGLSLVKALVEMHDGNITVESEYGEGSKFVVELPAVVLENETDRKFYMQFEDSREERIRIALSDI